MKTEEQYFAEGTPIKDYMDQMDTHQEASMHVYNEFELPEDGPFISLLKEKKPHILAITEDWCGDAMMNNAILRRIAEEGDIEVRTVLRDENEELIDQYLTNGGRAIPIYIFLNEKGNVIGKWGPRAPQIQEYMTKGKSELPDAEDPAFEGKQEELFAHITREYATNEKFWSYVYESLSRALILALS